MRQDSDGRDAVPVWSVAQRVFGAIDGCPGTVVSVDNHGHSNKYVRTFVVEWADGSVPVVYPEDTIMVRKGFPWE